MHKITFRFLIITFWCSVLLLTLYGPKIRQKDFQENSITVFTWGDIFDPSIIESFEKETGIRVHLNYYSANEELLVKLKATKAEGYDLIVPSDYAVRLLRREQLLQPLDKSKIHFWKDLNPVLLNLPYDTKNAFSIPFSWEIFGFGVDKDYFAGHELPESWRLIFDKNFINYRIGMVNDPIDATEFASMYLYGPQFKKANLQQQKEITHLLKEQHKWVEVYANFRTDYLLATKNCPVVVSSSSYIWRTMRLVPFVRFVIPKEGTFITIENLCIPKASKKQDLVYRFMNYLYRTESSAKHFSTFGFFPSTIHTDQWPDLDPMASKLIHATPEEFGHYRFLHEDDLPEATLRNLWVEVKTQ